MTLTLSLGRQFQPARSAILTPSLCGASAVGALGREPFAHSWQFSAVYVFVTGLAQGNAVGDIVTQRLMVLPRHDVVRLNSTHSAALLAGVIISLVDRITPLAVFVGVALFVGVLFALGCVAALLTAILSLEMSIGRVKRLTAPLAGEKCLRPVGVVAFVSALGRTKTAVASDVAEWLTADGAHDGKAIVTLPRIRILGYECFAALAAGALCRLKLRGCCIFHMLNYTPACDILHALERWHQHTGQTPCLLTSGSS